MTEVRLPESLETINSSAFEGCSALEKIELPDNIEQIGMYAFEDCTALKSVKLPARLTDIDQAVFAGCESLENIVIPEGVTSIKYRAFDGCVSIRIRNIIFFCVAFCTGSLLTVNEQIPVSPAGFKCTILYAGYGRRNDRIL